LVYTASFKNAQLSSTLLSHHKFWITIRIFIKHFDVCLLPKQFINLWK
jgi:hypothetical protein